MKTNFVECTNDSGWLFRGPRFKEVCEVEFSFQGTKEYNSDQTYFFLVGYNEKDSGGNRVSYNSMNFREIEFPAPLEEEIKECLTRELVEVRPYEHLSYNELYDRLMQSIRECEEILKSLKA